MDEFKALVELLGMLVWHPVTGVLIALMVVAAVIDWKTMRIPNWLTLSGVVYAFGVHALNPVSVSASLLSALAGLAIGLVVVLPLYAVRVMGAGDVKLMAMAGAFLGGTAVFKAVLFVFVVGGIAAVVFVMTHRAVARLATNLQQIAFGLITPGVGVLRLGSASVGKLPYGMSIAAGTIAFLVARQLGYVV